MKSCDRVANHATVQASVASLPEDIRQHARRAYRLFRADPRHASLRFKKVDEESNVYSVRIGLGTARRALWMVQLSSGSGLARTLIATACLGE